MSLKFIFLRSYDNYLSAHLVLSRLEEEHIKCYLLNENSVTISPFLSNSMGGIQLMVNEAQVARALELLKKMEGPGDEDGPLK